MYDVTKLKTTEECRTVMDRARRGGQTQVYQAVFRRFCKLAGSQADDPEDPLVQDFYEALAAYEQILSERNGRITPASYTRRKIQNKGIHQSLVEWASDKTEKNGFTLLIDMGLPEYTAEYLVARYADSFPADVVTLAKTRLELHNVELPTKNNAAR